MGKLYTEIDASLRSFISAQHVFFLATAPDGPGGHVNCSPKGLDSFRVIGPTTVAYLDFVGSGVETIAHIRQNGRIVIMFCAFEGAPRILRLHGRGTAYTPAAPGFASLAPHFGNLPTVGVRAMIQVDVTRIGDSCGFGVPRLRFEGHRDQMPRWAERKGIEGLETYQREKNAASIDGLEGLHWPARPEVE